MFQKIMFLIFFIFTSISCGRGQDTGEISFEHKSIVNGKETASHALKTTVRLNNQCSGVRITDVHVLFAAHCLYNTKVGYMYMNTEYFPDKKIIISNYNNKESHAYTVEWLFINPTYVEENKRRYYENEDFSQTFLNAYDLAIIKLTSPIIGSSIAKISMKTKFLEDDKFTITGFGRTDIEQTKKTKVALEANALLHNGTRYMEHFPALKEFSILIKGTFLDDTTGVIREGDSGGGLFHNGELIGINSFGAYYPKMESKRFSAHSRVVDQLDWIEESIDI